MMYEEVPEENPLDQEMGDGFLTAKQALDFIRQWNKDYRAACDIGAESMYGEATYAAGAEKEIAIWDSIECHLDWHFSNLKAK